MKNTTTKKASAKKKLLPAAGSLAISAVMLSTSTYAWFTMSREVEVTGIKMTASVPQNLEISLGEGMISSTALATTNTNTNATKVNAPANTGLKAANERDWTNSVAVSDYYDFGYLLPASSINGTDVWYTLNANDAGRSVDVDAEFAQADDATPEMTSFDIITSKTHTANYAEGVTKGYYIDIPVWFRTSSTENIELGVVAKISTGRNDTNGNASGAVTGDGDLYKAARVAILDANGAENSETDGANKVIADSTVYANAAALQAGYYNRYNAAQCGGTAVDAPQAVKAAGKLDGTLTTGTTAGTSITNAGDLYGTVSFLTQATKTGSEWDGDTVVTVPAASGSRLYGTSVEKTIRVWLEGEDVNCWNPNAKQSFTIDLRFVTLGELDAPTAANNS